MKKNIILFLFIISLSGFSQEYRSPFDFPLFLSGTFGELRNDHFHTGIDIKTNEIEGHKLYAIEKGYISRIKVSTWGYGKVLYINHPNGHTSVYAHMLRFNDRIEALVQKKQYKKESFEIEIYLKKDQIEIKKGEIIGLAGNTGGSGGPHLHFEIRDTKTEKPLNPLNYGFKVTDNISPVISAIKIYPQDNAKINNLSKAFKQNSTKNNSKNLKQGYDEYSINPQDSHITISGDVSFGISTFDRQNGAPNNKNGVYSIKLFLNNKIIHHFEVDKLDFSKNRFINAHIDYEEYKETNKRYNRCHKLPYNELSNYDSIINNGIVSFTDSNTHNIRFEVRDIEGNLSILKLKIKSAPQQDSPKRDLDKSNIFKYDQENILIKDNFEMYMERYSLYQDEPIIYSILPKQNNTISRIHSIMKESIPVQKYYVLSIKEDIPKKIKEKVYIAKLLKNKTFQYKGKSWDNEFLSTKTRDFGKYCIVADSIKPTISTFRILKKENIYGGNGIISCKINDNESGISYYRGEIDGKWILMEYDYKINSLTYHVPRDFKSGKHNISIMVRDKLNNESVYSKEFIY